MTHNLATGRPLLALRGKQVCRAHLGALLGEVAGHVAHGDRPVERGAEGAARHLADLHTNDTIHPCNAVRYETTSWR